VVLKNPQLISDRTHKIDKKKKKKKEKKEKEKEKELLFEGKCSNVVMDSHV